MEKSKSDFDPASLNDEIAQQTDWNPLKKGGTNTTDYKLDKVSDQRVEFKARKKMYFVSAIFILMGIAAVIKFSMEQSGSLLFYGGIGIGILLILIGISKMINYAKPRVFDSDSGYFWRGKKKPDTTGENTEEQCRLNDIHAIQLIQERIQSSGSGSSSYYSFEMNLILENGRRINVVDHGALSRIREDAKKLSEFLNKPVWDAITREF